MTPRGRPPAVDTARLAEAVLAIGFDRVTVPLVAEHLGIGAATVYRHVPDRAALLTLAWERVTEQIAWPARDDGWEPVLRAHARTLDTVLTAHPGVVTALAGTALTPATTRVLLDLTLHLHRSGFTLDDATLVVDTVIDLVVDHRLAAERMDRADRAAGAAVGATDGATDGAARGTAGDPAQAARAEHAAALAAAGPDTADPALADRARAAAAWQRAVRTDPARWLDRRLDLVLAGARTLLPD